MKPHITFAAVILTALSLCFWGAIHPLPGVFANGGSSISYFSLNFCSIDHGSATVSPIGPTYVAGTTVTVTAVPADGYVFLKWTGDITPGQEYLSTVEIVVDRHKSLCPIFIAEMPSGCQLALDVVEYGAASIAGVEIQEVDPNDNIPIGSPVSFDSSHPNYPYFREYFPCGSKFRLIPDEPSGVVFDSWSGTDSSNLVHDADNGVWYITVDAEREVVAEFSALHELTVAIPPHEGAYGGTVSVQETDGMGGSVGAPVEVVEDGEVPPTAVVVTDSYAHGTDLEFTATPIPGYSFIDWKVDSVPQGLAPGEPLELELDAARTVEAVFTKNCDLIVSIEGNGTVEVRLDGALQPYTEGEPAAFPCGTTLQVTPVPFGTDSAFTGWEGDLAGAPAEAEPQDILIDGEKTIVANFGTPGLRPIIELLGDAEMEGQCGTPFTDPGADSTNELGDTPYGTVVASGDVDTGSPGIYTITYTCEFGGIAAEPVVRTVEVVDTTAPDLYFIPESGDAVTIHEGVGFVEPVAGYKADDQCEGDLTANVQVTGDTVDETTVPGVYTRTYTVSDSVSPANTAVIVREITVYNNPPVLSLNEGPNGSVDFTIKWNADPYVEPGWTVTDEFDDNATLEGSVIVTGTVDHTVIDTYTLTYSVSDSKGNQATVQRTVTVAEDVAPVIIIDGPNPLEIDYLGTYDNSDVRAEDDFDDDTVVTATIVETGMVDSSVLAPYTLYYDVEDSAGNPAVQVQRVVEVKDLSPPVITLGIVGGSVNFTVPRHGTYTEPSNAAVDAYDGNVSVQITGSVDTSESGDYVLQYDAIDAAGNEAVTKYRTVTVADDTPPVITLIGDAAVTVPYGSPAYVDPGATATDDIDGDLTDDIQYGGDVVDTLTPGDYTLTYDVTDGAGNAAQQVIRTITVAVEVPLTLSVSQPQNGTIEVSPPSPAHVVDDTSPATSYFTYAYGDALRIRALPDTGYRFVAWGGDLGGAGGEILFADLFTGAMDSAWAVESGTWTATSNQLVLSSGAATVPTIARPQTQGDVLIQFSYRHISGTGTLDSYLRWIDSDNNLFLRVTSGAIELWETDSGTPAKLAENQMADTQLNGYYVVGARCEGDTVTVLRSANGGPEAFVLQGSGLNTTTTSEFKWASEANTEYQLDNFRLNGLESDANLLMDSDKTISATFEAVSSSGPAITLLGNASMTVECGTTFEDPGAIASDAEDGGLTNVLHFDGAVDTTTPGQYTLTYTVSDLDGNAATPVTRTVDVVDTTPPIISLTGPSELVVARFTTYTDAGASAEDSCDTSIATLIGDASAVDTTTYGTYGVTYDVSDASGNAAATVTRTVHVWPTLTLQAVGDGDIAPGTGQPIFLPYNETVQLAAIPPGAFDHWEGGGFDSQHVDYRDPSPQILMDGSKFIIGYFQPSVAFVQEPIEKSEGESATMNLALNRVSANEVTVDFAFSGGTATDGVDFVETGQAPFAAWSEKFEDEDLTGWTGDGTWSAAGGVLQNFGAGGSLSHSQAEDDFQMAFAYASDGTTTADVMLRENAAGDDLVLRLDPTLDTWTLWELPDAGGASQLASGTANMSAGTWYEVYVLCNGTSVEAWYMELGAQGSLAEVLSTDAATVLDTTTLGIAGGFGSRFDDFTIAAMTTYGTVTIPAGDTTGSITFDFVDDEFFESDETFEISLSNPVNAGLGLLSSLTATILDNDTEPEVYFQSATSAADESSGNAPVAVVIYAPAGDGIWVDYTVGGTANGPGVDEDHGLVDGTVYFAPGQTIVVIDVPLTDDAASGTVGTVEITLDAVPTNATLGTPYVHTLTIEDNDTTVQFDTLETVVVEEETQISLDVSLSGAAAADVTVTYEVVAAGTMAENGGTDFTLVSGELTFVAPDITETITVDIHEDAFPEPDETIEVRLSNPVFAELGDRKVHTVTIEDEDADPDIAFEDPNSTTIVEDAGPAVFDVELSSASEKTITVDYVATSGDAEGDGKDYTFMNGTLEFAPGVMSMPLSLAITNDAIDENDETVTITLTSPENAALGARDTYAVVIEDNDLPPAVTFATPSSAVTEGSGENGMLAVTLSNASGLDISVGYSVVLATATVGEDYIISGTQLEFEAGETMAYIPFQVIDDLLDEPAEYVAVEFTTLTNVVAGNITSHKFYIQDDDGAPVVRFDLAHSSIAEDGAEATFDAVLSRPSGKTVSVNYAVTGGTATGGGIDYSLPGGGGLLWVEDFNDGTLGGWTDVSEAWRTLNGYLEPLSEWQYAHHPFYVVDFELHFSYRRTDTSSANLVFHNVGPGYMRLALYGPNMTLFNHIDGTETAQTAAIPVPSVYGTWYEAVVRRVGGTVEVYQREKDSLAPPTLYLSAVGVQLGSFDELSFSSQLNMMFDDIGTTALDDTAATGTLTFQPGQDRVSLPVAIVNDSLNEADETVELALNTPLNATLATAGPNEHTLAIIDNDAALPAVTFDLSSSSIDESGGQALLDVLLSEPSGQVITVAYGAAGGDAIEGRDYNLLGNGYPHLLMDGFDDLDISDWSGDGTFSAANGYLQTSARGSRSIDTGENDFRMWFNYKHNTSWTTFALRNQDPVQDGHLDLTIYADHMTVEDVVGGTSRELASITVVTDDTTWYEYFVRCAGPGVEIWRRVSGDTGPFTRLLAVDTATTLESTRFILDMDAGAYLDDLIIASAYPRSLEADFNEDDLSGWDQEEIGGLTYWSASNGYLENSSEQGQGSISTSQFVDDFELRFSYNRADAGGASVSLRDRGGNDDKLWLQFRSSHLELRERVGGVETLVASAELPDDTAGVWYEMNVRCTGGSIEAWRREKGINSALAPILTASNVNVTQSDIFRLSASPGFYVDDIAVTSAGTTEPPSPHAFKELLVFQPGETTKQIAVDILDDTIHELDELVSLGLSEPTNVFLGTIQSHDLVIQNNDAVPTAYFIESTSGVNEGDESATVDVALTHPSSQAQWPYVQWSKVPADAAIGWVDFRFEGIQGVFEEFSQGVPGDWEQTSGIWTAENGYLEQTVDTVPGTIRFYDTIDSFDAPDPVAGLALISFRYRLMSTADELTVVCPFNLDDDIASDLTFTITQSNFEHQYTSGPYPQPFREAPMESEVGVWYEFTGTLYGELGGRFFRREVGEVEWEPIVVSEEFTFRGDTAVYFDIYATSGAHLDDVGVTSSHYKALFLFKPLGFAPEQVYTTLELELIDDTIEEGTEVIYLFAYPGWDAHELTVNDNDMSPVIEFLFDYPEYQEDSGINVQYVALDGPSLTDTVQVSYTLSDVSASEGSDYLNLTEKTLLFDGGTSYNFADWTVDGGTWQAPWISNVGSHGFIMRPQSADDFELTYDYNFSDSTFGEVLLRGGIGSGEDFLLLRHDESELHVIERDGGVENTLGTYDLSKYHSSSYIGGTIRVRCAGGNVELSANNAWQEEEPAFLANVTGVQVLEADDIGFATSNGDFFNRIIIRDFDGFPATGTLTIAPGEFRSSIVTSIIDDYLTEADETFQITLSNPVNATLGTNTVQTITVVDNDDMPSVEFASVASMREEDDGTIGVEVTLSSAFGENITVNYTVDAASTATGGGTDYTLLGTGTLTIGGGQPSSTIELTLVDDGIAESDKTVILNLSSPSGANLGTQSTHTLTITDPKNTVEFATATSSTTEPATTTQLDLTVNLETAATGGETVDYAVVGGSADSGVDYTLLGTGTLTFTSSATSGTISLDIEPDALYEMDETVTIALSNPAPTSSVMVGANDSHTVTIQDDGDTMPVIEFASASSNSGESTSPVSLTLTLTATDVDTSVDYAIGPGGTATYGNDYTFMAGTLEISAGSSPGTIDITIVDDIDLDDGETVVVELSNAVGATLGTTTTHTVTIDDNEVEAAYTTTSSSVDEDVSGSEVIIPVTLSAAHTGTLDYAVTPVDATGGGTDFTLADGTLTFSASTTPDSPLTVQITNDSDLEDDETLVITLANPATPATPQAAIVLDAAALAHTLTIVDNEVGVSFDAATSNAAEDVAGGEIAIPVTVTEAITGSVEFEVTGGSATGSGTDYTLANGTLNFDGSATLTQVITVTIVDDMVSEPVEDIVITLTNPLPADRLVLGGDIVHTLSITDNDGEPTVAFAAATSAKVEGDGDGTIDIDVTLTGSASSDVTVDYAIADGTATSELPNPDYTVSQTTGTFTFTPGGATTQSITITVLDDNLDEDDQETVFLALSNVSNAELGDDDHILTIMDNDMSVSFESGGASQTVVEKNSGKTTIAIPVVLTGTATADTAINYFVAPASSADSVDFSLVSGSSVTIPNGQSSADITLEVFGDPDFEADETITIVLGSAGEPNVAIGMPSTYTVTIENDDLMPILQFSQAASNLGEGSTDAVEVSLTHKSYQTISATYSMAGAGATAGGDFTADTGSVVFNPGTTTQTIAVEALEDAEIEAAEDFTITLADVTNATAGLLTHTVTILDNETPVRFKSAATSATEGADIMVNITVEMDEPVTGPDVAVDFAVTGGTAQAGYDYFLYSAGNMATGGTLAIPAGAKMVNIPVLIVDDGYHEAGETVEITLSSPQNAGLGTPATHNLTINDNDEPGSETPDFTVGAITGPTSGHKVKAGQPLTVNFSISNTGGTGAQSNTAVLLSRQATLGAAPEKVLAQALISVPAGGTVDNIPIEINAMSDVAPGLYYLIVQPDAIGQYPGSGDPADAQSVAIVVIDKVLTNE